MGALCAGRQAGVLFWGEASGLGEAMGGLCFDRLGELLWWWESRRETWAVDGMGFGVDCECDGIQCLPSDCWVEDLK